jgi:hypothetical protein
VDLVTFAVVYDPAARDSGGPTVGARLLMAAIVRRYPPGTNLGIYNPRDQRGSSALSLHAEGRAIDIGYPFPDDDGGVGVDVQDLADVVEEAVAEVFDGAGDGASPAGHPVANRLVADLVAWHAALGVQCVIYNRRIWSTSQPLWRPYTGTDPHTGHVHLELNRAASTGLTAALVANVFATPTTQGEQPMAAPDVEAAQRMLNSWGAQLEPDGDWGPASTTALKKILDDTGAYINKIRDLNEQAARTIAELKAALTNTTPPATDADRTLGELRAVLRKVVG